MYAETGDDFVEDEQRTVFVAECAHFGVVIEVHGAGAAFGADGLDDYRRRTAAEILVEFQIIFEHLGVVGTHLVNDLESAVGNAVGFEELSGAGHLGAVDHLVGPAVIRAADFDDSLLLGRAACDSERAHNGLRAAAEHTEFLDVGHTLVYLFRDEQFRLVEQTRDGAAFLDELDGLFLHRGIVAAEDGGSARLQKVDILVPVYVIHIGAFRLDHTHRERLVEGKVVLNAAGDILLGFGGDGLGLRALLVIVVFADVLVCLFRNAVNGLGSELFQALVDFLRIRPARYAVTGFLFAFQLGVSDFHNMPSESFDFGFMC